MTLGPLDIVMIVIASLAGLTLLVGLPVWLGTRYALREREMEHAERIKALEMGLLLPKDQPKWTPETLPLAIGAGVPLAALVAALAAVQMHAGAEEAWIGSSLLGTAGVICGTILAMARRFDHSAALGPTVARDGKPPAHDPDAFDVVSRRG